MKTAFLTNKKQILAWLDKHKVKNYTLVPNAKYGFVVNVNGDVDLSNNDWPTNYHHITHQKFKKVTRFRVERMRIMKYRKYTPLRHVPIKFKKVTGHFKCNFNELKNLKCAPQYVGGMFLFRGNKIKNLDKLPKKIGRSIDLGQNELVSLIGSPRTVYGSFDVSYNSKLQSLKGSPVIVENSFKCAECAIETLKGGPKYVGKSKTLGAYWAPNNCLTSLKGISEHIGGVLCIANYDNNPRANRNKIKDFDYLPKFLEGNIMFEESPELSGYINIPAKEIVERFWQKKLAISTAKKEVKLLKQNIDKNENADNLKKMKI